MARLFTAVLAVVASSCLIFSKEADGLQCRSGFNTSVYNIPIQLWDDSTECSTSSQQSCFLGELTYDVSFLSEELSFTYGSCVSKAYQSTLECENLIGPNPTLNLDQISLLIPDLQEQFSGAIEKFSEDAASELITILQNQNGQFDNAKIIESLLNALNVTAPDNTKQVITKLDSLILTLIVNASQAGEAASEFLSSFSSLGTSNVAASSLLYNFFDTMNVTVPSNFKPIIDNLPGFVSQYIKNDPNFVIVNATLHRLISSIDTTNPLNTVTAVSKFLSEALPAQYNLAPLFNSVPSLVSELMNENFEYINQWQLNLLATYSRNTSATHALSSSIFNLLKRTGLYDQVPEEVKTVITYQPGYIYNFLSADEISEMETIYYSIASNLDAIDPSAGVDIGQILQSMGLSVGLPDQLTSVLNGFIKVSMTGNATALGLYSLESLKQSSIVTTESLAMSNSITAYLGKFNVTVSSEVEDVIKYAPGLLLVAFPNDTALINAVFLNVSQNLDNTASTITGDIGAFDLTSSLQSSLAPLLTLNLTAEVKNFLQQLPSQINMSDPVGSLTKLIELSKTIIPSYLQSIVPVLNTLPEVFTQVMQGNLEYLNTWQLELLKSVSVITPATESFSNAIFNMTKRFGIYENITDDMKTLIMYQPGYFYLFMNGQTEVFDMILGNLTAAVDSIDPTATIDLSSILSMISPTIEFPGMENIISMLEGFFKVAITGDVNAIGTYGLEALKNSSVLTTESRLLSNSIVNYISGFNVSLPDPLGEIITYFPGIFVAAYPDNVATINSIYLNISRGLDNADMSATLDISSMIESIVQLNLTTEVKNFLQQLPSQINMSDPVGSLTNLIELSKTIIPSSLQSIVPVLNTLPEVFTQIMQGNLEYLNTWQLELLKSVSVITPATEKFSNAIFNMTKRFGIYDNITDDMKTLIMYQPGYFYLFTNGQTDFLDVILGNLTTIVDSIDPTATIDLSSMLSMISPAIEFPGMENIISMLEGFFKVAMTGNVEAIGTYGLEALKNSSVLTTESTLLSNSIVNFISRFNVSLPDPLGEIIKYFPGIFVAAFPDNVATINGIYLNISHGLDNADISATPDISNMIESSIQQLQMTGVTFPPEVQSLLNGLGAKVNINDPVGTYEAFLEIANVILPAYDNGTLPLLNAVPDLLNQLVQGNFTYINTWQINLLKLYSTTTEATTALSNSIFEMLRRFGVYDQLTEDYKTLITYQPGYFYQFFPDKAHYIDAVYYNISSAVDDVGTTSVPDLQELLKRIDGSIDLTGMDPLLDSFEILLTAASSGNVTNIFTKTVEILKNISRVTTDSSQLSSTVISMIEMFVNSSLPSGVNDIITYVPGVLITFFPEQKELIDMVYQRMSQSIQDSFSGTVNVEQMIDDAVTQLNMANITLPTELTILFDNLPTLIDATISNNETAIDAWFTTVLPLISPTGTTETAAISNAIRHLVYQLEGVPQSKALDAIIEYLPRMPYQAFSEQTQLLNTVYTSIANALSNINLTSTAINFGDIFGNIDTSLLPPELVPFLNSAQDMIMAAMTNNETLWMQWLNTIKPQYCESNTVTVDFSKAFFDQMNQFDTKMPANVMPALECIPGTMYKFFPNQTQMLDEVFGQMTMSVGNYSEYIASQFKRINQTIPSDLAIFLEAWRELQPALMQGNFSEVVTVLTQMNNQMARETELSKLIETVLGKYSVEVTDEMRLYIRQSTVQVYNPALSEYIPTFDTIFMSLNADIAAGTDIGVAIKNAFAKVNIEIYDRIVPVLDNLQSLIDASLANDGALINQAILDIMVSYNASFPSDQTQYAIYQYRLQLLLMNLQSPNIPDEAFEYLGEMYQLMLKFFKTSEDDLKAALLNTFPDGEAFIEIFFTFDPKEAFSIGTSFITWLADPQRNATTLASHIKSAIDILMTRYNIDIESLLSTIAKPKSCKFGACDTEGCNAYDLVKDIDPVTPVPEETTTPTTTTESTTVTTAVETPKATQPPITTTSGQVISSTKTVSWTLYLASAILAARWVAS